MGEEARSVDHHNLNTLVDVATKMRPVTDKPATGDNDSSGSGAASPEKKKVLTDKLMEGGKIGDAPTSSKQQDTLVLGPQLFSVNIMAPLSPDGQRKKAMKGPHDPTRPPPDPIRATPPHEPVRATPPRDPIRLPPDPIRVPPTHDHLRAPHDHLRQQAMWNDTKPSVIPSIVSFSNMQHGDSPALYHQAPSVIQGSSDKGKPRKRKLLPQNETNKRVSPPMSKDGLAFMRSNDHKLSLPPLPVSFTSSRPDPPNNQRRDHHQNDLPPPGFTFDPSLPMAYDYQLISYKAQLKSSEEAADDAHTLSKIVKRPRHIEAHDMLPVAKGTRSPSPNLRRPMLHPPGILAHDQRMQFSSHANRPERPSKDPHGTSVVKSHKKHNVQRKPEYSTHIKKDPDGPLHPALFMSAPQGMFGLPQGPQLSSSGASSISMSPHWPVASAIPHGKPIKTDPSEHHSSQHRSTPSPHPSSVSKKQQDWNKPHIVDNKPHIQHHGNKHDSSRHHISTSANTLSQISPTNCEYYVICCIVM